MLNTTFIKVLTYDVDVHTNKEQREDDDELIDSMSKDVLGHGAGDERLVATVWFPLQQRLCGRFRCQGQRSKGIHDKIHPQHLHCLQRGVLEKSKKKPDNYPQGVIYYVWCIGRCACTYCIL